MNERIKQTAEELWQDEKLLFRVLPIMGLRGIIKSLREPVTSAEIHNFEPRRSRRSYIPEIDRETVYPTAA